MQLKPCTAPCAKHRADEVNFPFNEDRPRTDDTFSAMFRLHAGEPYSNEGGIFINFDNPLTGEGEEPRANDSFR